MSQFSNKEWEHEEATSRENALEEDFEKGERNKAVEIVKKMAKENINTETIIRITGLSKEEIQAL